MKYTVGIDEVGRGPLAGPVTVCAVLWLHEQEPRKIFGETKDSKKLSEKKRNELTQKVETVGETYLRYAVCSENAETIDEKGISQALLIASTKALNKLNKENQIQQVHADYGLPLPKHYQQMHMIKGDERHPLIALASVIAKVKRDAVMKECAKTFTQYGFEKNKGYGTKEHRDAIQREGVTKIHRKTFLRKILKYHV